MPPGIGVKRGDPDQPVDPGLAFQVTIRIITLNFRGSRFDAPLGLQPVHFLHGESLPFRPAEVHPVEHLGPVTGFGSPGPGMDCEKTAVFIHLAAHEFQDILFFMPYYQGFQIVFYFPAFRFIPGFQGQFPMGFKVVNICPEAFPGFITASQGLEFGHGFFRRGGIIPETGFSGFRFDSGYALFKGSVLKDASRYRRFGFLIPLWGFPTLITT
jgi:hypothetical protein